MKTAAYQEALDASANFRTDDLLITPVDGGLINRTYKVTVKPTGYRYILQQINKEVFPEPEKLIENYHLIWGMLHHDQPEWIPFPVNVPQPLRFADGCWLFCDDNKEYWRIFEFIDKTTAFSNPVSFVQAKKIARTFGCLTSAFEYYPIEKFHITISGFHDLSLRYRQFKESLHCRNFNRLHKAAPLINELKKREHYVSLYEVITGSDEFEKRLMHHDAKISNILFDEEDSKIICMVDLDTCMPGYFFSDLGDMIRSMAFSDNENNTKTEDLYIRKDYYEAIIAGYLEVMDRYLTDAEKKYIHHSGLLIIYMQSLRFLTDYLNDDIYYKTSYEEHNFDRAKNQITLLQKLEEFLKNNYSIKI